MPEPSLSRSERFKIFSDELDVIASRATSENPGSPEGVEAIFAEHEAECQALEAVERERTAERESISRRA